MPTKQRTYVFVKPFTNANIRMFLALGVPQDLNRRFLRSPISMAMDNHHFERLVSHLYANLVRGFPTMFDDTGRVYPKLCHSLCL